MKLAIMKLICAFIVGIYQFGLAQADCNSLPVIDNTTNNATGTISAPYASGTYIKFECRAGFNPTGTSKIYICSGNTWTNGNLKCQQIYCNNVLTPENGRVINAPTNEVGSSINFACNEGYDMKGDDTLLCRTDGNWMPREPPTCNIKSCGEFGSIQHATTFQDSSNNVRDGYGSVVKVTCKSGYVINGPPHVRCQGDGTWGKRPKCEVSTCPPYPGLNSSCIKHTSISDNFLFMICKDDTKLVTKTGPDVIECIKGQWEDTDVMACYCNCEVIADTALVSLNNVNEGYLKHTHTLDWSCKKGATKEVTKPLVCNDGNPLKPLCKSSSPITYAPVTDKDGSTVNPPPTDLPKTDSPPIGPIVGGIAGGLAVVISCVIGVYCYKTKKKNKSCNEKGDKCDKTGTESEKEKIPLSNNTDGDAV